jgi:hypothetical protein
MDATHTRTASQAKIDANRRNAAKSTGPRTAQGKAASSRNGLTHGLSANKHILLDEDPEEFLLLLKDLYDRFQPVGLAEERLVQRIAAAQWRLDRVFPMEASIYRNRLREVAEEDADQQRKYAFEKECAEFEGRPAPREPAPFDEGDLLARAFDADCVAPNSLAKLARYEGALERSLDRTLRQLKAFQAARNTSDATAQPDPDAPAESPDHQENKPPDTPDGTAAPAENPPENMDCKANPNHESECPNPPQNRTPKDEETSPSGAGS